MFDVAGFVSGHPVVLAILAAGGLVLILLPLVAYFTGRRGPKDPPPDR